MNGTITVFIYDEAGHLLGEYDQNGSLIEEHIWLNNQPIGVITPNGLYYVQTDRLGTPRYITNSSKQLVWEWQNDPFGMTAPNQNPSGLGTFTYNLRFPGQYYDAETGHNYNYFRDYDPTVGRYIESDPIGLGGGVNTYAYVGNNPLTGYDLFGLVLLNLFNPASPEYQYAQNIVALDMIAVAGHGDSTNILDENGKYRLLTAGDLAKLIKNLPDYKRGEPIRLYACYTGAPIGIPGLNNFAQQLANILGTPVTAPNNYGWLYYDGDYVVAPPLGGNLSNGPDLAHPGQWVTFLPSGGVQ